MAPRLPPVARGDVFSRLTVLREVPKRGEAREFLCKCACGNRHTVRVTDLRSGSTRSCGCYSRETRTSHGLSKHRLYYVWCDMMKRCYNEGYVDYHHYGGRGITVCAAWRDSVTNFVNWGEANGYARGLEIDRRNNDRGYTPSNCRFVTRRTNLNNRRVTTLVRVKGKDMPLADAVRQFSTLPFTNVYHRIRCGWPVWEALTAVKGTTLRSLRGLTKTPIL